MIVKSTHIALIISLFACFSTKVTGQNQEKVMNSWFDNVIGQTNAGMFKGVAYTNQFRVINKRHQFFKTSNFKLGSITYKGQRYFNVPLKYDIYSDNILGENYELENRPVMVFDTEDITEFTIDGHLFERIANEEPDRTASTFFEVLLRSESVKLYKNYSKKIFKRTDKQSVYYEFKDGYSYLLLFDGKSYSFKKPKELNRIFPNSKKELNAIRKKHSLLKETGDDYIKAILADLLLLKPIPAQTTL